MRQYNFGSGNMVVIPPVTVPTPIQLGSLQEVTIGFSASNKELAGQNQYAEIVARGMVKVSGKAKFARINAAAYNAVFFNETAQTGMTLAAFNELGTIPSATAYTVTVANSVNFSQDMGVVEAATGKIFTRVASAPSAYQYSVTNGVYTFAQDDKSKKVLISYLYTDAAGTTITLNNTPTGEAPSFQAVFNGKFSGKQTTMILYSCVSNKLDLIGTKTEDFTIPEFDFTAFAPSGVLGLLSTHG